MDEKIRIATNLKKYVLLSGRMTSSRRSWIAPAAFRGFALNLPPDPYHTENVRNNTKIMEIRTLELATLQEVTEAFNGAFIDYKISLQMTGEAMASKIKSEGIQLRYSAGAYRDGRLVGFILNGTDTVAGEPLVYNGGTGTLPPYRGRGISHALYRFLLPRLAGEGLYRHQLEVFTDNVPAKKVYTDTGFTEKRLLHCFRGNPGSAGTYGDVTEAPLLAETFSTFGDVQPSWQNGFPSILRNPGPHEVIGIRKEEQWVAYAVFVPATGRVRQFAVQPEWRGKGLGRQLFAAMTHRSKGADLLVTNLETNPAVLSFMERIGPKPFLKLAEMTLDTRTISF